MLIGRSQLRFFSKLAPCLAFARDGQDDVQSCCARSGVIEAQPALRSRRSGPGCM